MQSNLLLVLAATVAVGLAQQDCSYQINNYFSTCQQGTDGLYCGTMSDIGQVVCPNNPVRPITESLDEEATTRNEAECDGKTLGASCFQTALCCQDAL